MFAGIFSSVAALYKLCCIIFSFHGFSQENPDYFQGLVLEQLNNGGAVDGTTYRLYAEITSGKVVAVWADVNNLSTIETSTVFFNETTIGGNFQSDSDPSLFDMFAGLEWDTWITIGDDYESSPSEIGTLNLNGLLSNSWSFGESLQGVIP